ncbi:MAG: hypothetical protein VX185_06785 [Pseudomonadota bacterium]|nr:hypothetical protein [Pseudomonadota bacterium]
MLAAAVMTAYPGAVDLAVKPKMLADIERKHGEEMNNYWKEEFGYGIEQLTQGEAGHLRKVSTVDAIRDRITAARNAAGWTMDESRAGQTSAAESEDVKRGAYQDKADAFRSSPHAWGGMTEVPDGDYKLSFPHTWGRTSMGSIKSNIADKFLLLFCGRVCETSMTGANYIKDNIKNSNDAHHSNVV